MHGQSVSALLASTEGKSEVNMEVEEQSEDQPMEGVEANDGKIDLMDIDADIRHERGNIPRKHFKIDSLIKKCIQPALGNVKDPRSTTSRAIDRLKIILFCLHHEEGKTNTLSVNLKFEIVAEIGRAHV